MKSNLLKFIKTLITVLLILFVFVGLFKFISYIFNEQWGIHAIFIFSIVINVFYVFKNGIRKCDFSWDKIKEGDITNYGGVAFFWLIVMLCLWILYFFI